MEMETVLELLQVLHTDQRLELRAVALNHVLGLSRSAEGKSVLFVLPEIIYATLLVTNVKTLAIAKDAILSIINLTADEKCVQNLMEISSVMTYVADNSIIEVVNPENELADLWAMVLSNLTRSEAAVNGILNLIQKDPATISLLVKAFCQLNYNKKGAKLHYLASIFCNITQTVRGRNLICDPQLNVLEKIIPFIFFENVIRRGGTIGIFRNVCFDPIHHEKIIDEKNNIIHNLLFPLIGPEDFTDEENQTLPLNLQYIGEEKKREEEPDLRRMLLGCFLQLCATKKIREFLRAEGVYAILREYHKWEEQIGRNKDALRVCENVVRILIKKEEEIGVDNLKEAQVPSDLMKGFMEDENLLLHD